MSRADDLIIRAHESTIAGLREQVAGLRGELTGERRQESRVGAQLAEDIRRSAVREDGHRQAAVRAVGDVHRLLHVVAGHVLDERAAGSQSIELLVDGLGLAGFSLNGALTAVTIERADTGARADGHMSTQALLTAPVPPRTT